MPYYFRRWRKRWPRRRRYYRSWRSRNPFRRRFYRRRNWVRKKKLSKLILRQFQPAKIHKTSIKGIYPLLMCTSERTSHNLIQYLDSIAPLHWPGGGGMSLLQFNLNCLYEQFLKATNWWTKSNCNMPLVRYLGCSLKFYCTENFDYVVKVERCLPLEATDTMYLSTQPSILMLTSGSILVPCRKNSKYKKPYKKVFVKPPSQFTTKWLFQADICKFPLLIIRAAAASFDRYYTASSAISPTIDLNSLNTNSFVLHNWNTPPTSGYKPQENQWLYTVEHSTEPPENNLVKDLIYLGNTGPTTGQTHIGIIETNKVKEYFSNPKRWGNIFEVHNFMGDNPLFVTNKSPAEIIKLTEQSQGGIPQLTNNTTIKASQIFTRKTTPNIIECRYNPFADKAVGNKIFLVHNSTDRGPWEEPHDIKLMRQDLPLWLLTYAWTDWQNKLQAVSKVDTSYMTIIECPYIEPKQKYYLFLDQPFLQGTSPYSPDLFPSDASHWYPKNRYQVQSLNTIANTGPGMIKLQPEQSMEAHFLYKFHFKFGGCPPPMEKICSPAAQPTYPIPDPKYETTSLQNPTQPIQTYLYNFDERRGLLTEKAAKRMRKDYRTEKDAFPFTGLSTDLPPPHQKIQTTDTETSESEEETCLQLQLLRNKQKRLKRRILRLLTQHHSE
nr:MAG: ORF1 [TTV-like mini virus]